MKTKDRGELRTYTVIAATVQVRVNTMIHNGVVRPILDGRTKNVIQPLGRQAQQGQHVMGKYMWGAGQALKTTWKPTTGITLMCRDSAELGHVLHLINKVKICWDIFFDKNEKAYGSNLPVATAVCTEPVYKDQVTGILDYLPLWPGEQR